MSQSPRHSSHHVYPYELIGNTLVVRPKGDAVGFALHDVRQEMGEIKQLAADPRVKHLIIDLSAERYYGSMVLGDLVEFGQLVRSRGGCIGLAGASSDLDAVLKLMHLDEQWVFFPHTEAGLRAIAEIPISQRLWRYRAAAGWLVAACVIAAAVAFWPRTDRGAEYYAKVADLWVKYDQPRSGLGDIERDLQQQQVRKKLEPILDDLKRRGDRKRLSSLEQTMLFATRSWVAALDLPADQATRRYDDVRYFLGVAGDQAANRPPRINPLPIASIPSPTPSDTVDTTVSSEATEPSSSQDTLN